MAPHVRYGLIGIVIGLILFIVNPWLAIGVIVLAIAIPAVAYALLSPAQRARVRQARRRRQIGS